MLGNGGGFAADAPEAFGGADEEAAVGDGGGGVDGGVELGGGEAFEFGSGFDDDEIALLAAAEDFAVGSDGAAEEFGAALDAFDTLFVDDFAGFEFDAAKDAAVPEEVHVLADDDRGGDVGEAFWDFEIDGFGFAGFEVEGSDFFDAAASAEGAKVELVTEDAGAEAALGVAWVVLPVDLTGFEVDAHDTAAGVGADDFFLAVFEGVDDGGGEGVEAVGEVQFPGLLAGGGVEADDAGFPLLFFGVFGINFAVALPIELAADDHDAVFDDRGNASAVFVDVVGDVFVFPEEFAGVVEREGLDGGAGAPVDVDALGINEGGAAGEAVEVVDFVRDEFDFVAPEFFAVGGGESDDGAFGGGGFSGDDDEVFPEDGGGPAFAEGGFPEGGGGVHGGGEAGGFGVAGAVGATEAVPGGFGGGEGGEKESEEKEGASVHGEWKAVARKRSGQGKLTVSLSHS